MFCSPVQTKARGPQGVPSMHDTLVRIVYYADIVFIVYFIAANLGYTFLMLLSL